MTATLVSDCLSDCEQPPEAADQLYADKGPADRLPMRTCAVTRVEAPKNALMRFVIDPDGFVVPDLQARLPGRGVWLLPHSSVVQEAIKKRAFARAFRSMVKIADDLPNIVAQLLESQALSFLSLAHKAGALRAGFMQAEAALKAQEALALLHATDAADDGQQKLQALARRYEKCEVIVLSGVNSDQLGKALGRDSLMHVAVVGSAITIPLIKNWQAMMTYRQPPQVML